MKTLAVISLLALLTISGAAYTDQLFDQAHYKGEYEPAPGDDIELRLTCVHQRPAVMAASDRFPAQSGISTLADALASE